MAETQAISFAQHEITQLRPALNGAWVRARIWSFNSVTKHYELEPLIEIPQRILENPGHLAQKAIINPPLPDRVEQWNQEQKQREFENNYVEEPREHCYCFIIKRNDAVQ